jgi:hypothetical protein
MTTTRLVVATMFGMMLVIPSVSAQSQQTGDGIDCGQWKLNPDGSWDTGPSAMVFGMVFANGKNLMMNDVVVNGVEVTALLKKKCANQ